MIVQLILAISLAFPSVFANEENVEKPSWTNNLPKETSDYIFYIGRASENENESEGFKMALINAREQAIAENFGIATKFITETYQNNEKALSTQSYNSITPNVVLEEFEQVDFFRQQKNYWVLCRYYKKAIAKEKLRLQKLYTDDHPIFLESGSNEASKINGTLEINSYPAGAIVRVDGKSKLGDLELKTPMRILGLFKYGKHKIEIDHPQYKVITKEIELTPGLTTKISEKLEVGYGKLFLSSNTENAEIFINGKLIGKTPLDQAISIAAESNVAIELRHPEKYTRTIQSKIARDEIKYESINLQDMPGYISFTTIPRGAKIEINGQPTIILNSLESYEVTSGAVKLKVSHQGYETIEKNIMLKGAENLILPTIELKKLVPSYFINLKKNKQQTVIIDGMATSEDRLMVYPGIHQLEIFEANFLPLKKEINVGENEIIDINDYKLEPVPLYENNKHIFIGFGIAYPRNQLVKEANIDYLFGLSLSVAVSKKLNLELSYYNNDTKLPNTSNNNSNPNNVESTQVSLGTSLALHRSFLGEVYLTTEYSQIFNEYSYKWNDEKGSQHEKKFKNLKKKTSLGIGSLEYRYFFEKKDKEKCIYGIKIKQGVLGTKTFQYSTTLEVTIGF